VRYSHIIIILCLISSLTRFVLDIYLPSIPAISEDFAISSIETQLTLTLYLLGFGVSQLIYGPLSDSFGRRKVLLVGLFIFLIGNVFCTFALTKQILFLGRLITGIGAGSCGVLNRAIASDCFKGREFSKAWSITTTSLVITLCLAPVLGGYIQEFWHWRGNFLTAMAYVSIVLGIIFKYLPETNQSLSNRIWDLRKILIDYRSVLRMPSFLMGATSYTLAFSGLIAYFQISPLLLMEGLHLSPSQFGWCSLIIAFMYLSGGLFVNRYAGAWGTQKLLFIGTILLIIGGISMLLAYQLEYFNIIAILLPASVFVIGARIVIPNAIANSMDEIRHLKGSSSAVLGFMQMSGSSMISFCIAKFNHASSLPLSVLFILIGCTLLTLTMIKKDVMT